MTDTTAPPSGAPPHAIARDLRRLADAPGNQLTDAYRDGLRLLAGEVSKLSQSATGEPAGVDHGLTGEQECRAWAALAAATALGPAIAKQADDTFDVDADLADMASLFAAYIRDGSAPL